MANIPSSTQYMTDSEIGSDMPDTEALWTKIAGAMNSANDFLRTPWSFQKFTASGTWTQPNPNITQVLVIGIGGGSGGSGGDGSSLGGLGGRSGQWQVIPVTVSGNVSVTIGGGGAGGTTGASNTGSPGSDTSFGSTVFKGGVSDKGTMQGGAGNGQGGFAGWGAGGTAGVSGGSAAGVGAANSGSGGGGGDNNRGGAAGGSGCLYVIWLAQPA